MLGFKQFWFSSLGEQQSERPPSVPSDIKKSKWELDFLTKDVALIEAGKILFHRFWPSYCRRRFAVHLWQPDDKQLAYNILPD